jgi:hypothetical protein
VKRIGKAIKTTIKQIEDAPYFHLGRFGNYFVGWHVTSQEALGRVADALARTLRASAASSRARATR